MALVTGECLDHLDFIAEVIKSGNPSGVEVSGQGGQR